MPSKAKKNETSAKSFVVLGRYVLANDRSDVPIEKGARPGPSVVGKYKIVHAYEGPLPKGVTMDKDGRRTVQEEKSKKSWVSYTPARKARVSYTPDPD